MEVTNIYGSRYLSQLVYCDKYDPCQIRFFKFEQLNYRLFFEVSVEYNTNSFPTRIDFHLHTNPWYHISIPSPMGLKFLSNQYLDSIIESGNTDQLLHDILFYLHRNHYKYFPFLFFDYSSNYTVTHNINKTSFTVKDGLLELTGYYDSVSNIVTQMMFYIADNLIFDYFNLIDRFALRTRFFGSMLIITNNPDADVRVSDNKILDVAGVRVANNSATNLYSSVRSGIWDYVTALVKKFSINLNDIY